MGRGLGNSGGGGERDKRDKAKHDHVTGCARVGSLSFVATSKPRTPAPVGQNGSARNSIKNLAPHRG
jgi:hypothetical protein